MNPGVIGIIVVAYVWITVFMLMYLEDEIWSGATIIIMAFLWPLLIIPMLIPRSYRFLRDEFFQDLGFRRGK